MAVCSHLAFSADVEAAGAVPTWPIVTCSVRISDYANGMQTRLQPGDELRCPHCRQWHRVVAQHTTGTEYTLRMLYFVCRQGHYYAGQMDTPSRHPTRQQPHDK